MGAGAAEVHVDFSVEELAVLLPRVGVRRLAGIPLQEPPAEALAVAARGLVARGVLDDGGSEVLEAVREVLLLVGRPTIVAAGTSAAGPVVWAGDDEVVVRVAERAAGVWRATPLAVADLPAELTALLPGAGQPAPGPPFAVAGPAHAAAVALARSDPAGAVLHLRAGGVAEPAAVAYVTAVAAGAETGGLAMVRRADGEVRGLALGWLDAGSSGLWAAPPPADLPEVVERVDDGDGPDDIEGLRALVAVEVTPTSAAALHEAVTAGVAELVTGRSS